uniref:Uncharacterized protein n=1 Tax=Triticum urartu TaxID=4572 RepID=A0A8R7JVT5_TRIUA
MCFTPFAKPKKYRVVQHSVGPYAHVLHFTKCFDRFFDSVFPTKARRYCRVSDYIRLEPFGYHFIQQL